MKQTLTRLALTLPVVWLVVSLVFSLIHLVPGDPIQMMLGEGTTRADIGSLRHQYGLELPLGALLAGAIVTETIFSWPGLGRLVVSAISNRDYGLVQGCLLSIGLTYVLVISSRNVVYQWINPRMRG